MTPGIARQCRRQFIGQSEGDGTEDLTKVNSTTSLFVALSFGAWVNRKRGILFYQRTACPPQGQWHSS
jgi:hypothetical protein